jgi:formate dehydrogenase subunit gamma
MNRKRMSVRKALAFAGLAALFAVALTGIFTLSATVSPPAQAQNYHVPPPPDVAAAQASRFGTPESAGRTDLGTPTQNAAPGSLPRADLWRNIRQGVAGRTNIGGPQAGVLVQVDGENFRLVQNGPLPEWGGWMMLAMIVLLALYFAIHGRIRVEEGFSGHTILRFNFLERFIHWLTAIAFVLLALTGLNILYGRYVLKPIMGASAFATMTQWGKFTHDWIAFAFIVGLAIMFVMWVANNLPTKADVIWLLKGGGMFSRGTHPPAWKFNAGQKLLFWFLVLGGFSVSFSGLCLLMPMSLQPFAPTFAALNVFGLHLPTSLTVLQETQLALVWHAAVALLMITLILAHIYIGTLGMEGAFRAMTDGKVDENWAREHHPLWVEQLEQQETAGAAGQPAE